MEKGTADFEIEMVLAALISKKNIRLYFVSNSNHVLGGKQVDEITLNYDSHAEVNVLKFYLRPKDHSKIIIDILCNAFEYEILYKRAFPSIESQQNINEPE
jgi:hypothetical protein